MSGYLVNWEIDIEDADDPVDAARQALAHIVRPGSIAHVFIVREGEGAASVLVDLDELDGVADA